MQAVVTPAEGTACKGRALEQKAVGRNFSMIMMLTSLVKSLPTTVGEGASLVFPQKRGQKKLSGRISGLCGESFALAASPDALGRSEKLLSS